MNGSQRLADIEKRMATLEAQGAQRESRLSDALVRVTSLEARIPPSSADIEKEIGELRAELTGALSRLDRLQELVPVPG